MPKKVRVNIFKELCAALEDVLAYERGEAVDLRVTTIPAPRGGSPAKRKASGGASKRSSRAKRSTAVL
jgi:hypothetical protein